MYIATGQGQTTRGDKILMSTGTSGHFGHLLQVLKKSLWCPILYIFFFMILSIPGARADNPLGMKFWCQQEHLVTSVICCKFQNNLFEVWFYTFLFHYFIHVYSPGAGGRQPTGDKILISTEMSCHFIHLLKVFKKCLWSLILYNFYIGPGQGQTAPPPPRDTILMSTERPYHFTHLLQVSRNLFIHFFMIYCMYIARARRHTAPRGQSFDVNRNFLSLRSSVAFGSGELKRQPWYSSSFSHNF